MDDVAECYVDNRWLCGQYWQDYRPELVDATVEHVWITVISVLAGFLLAVLLSVVFATPRIAIASGAAFLSAQLLDIRIFAGLRDKAWWLPPFVSSVISSGVDTAIFFSVAFACGPIPGIGATVSDLLGQVGLADSCIALPWISLAVADYLVKLALAALSEAVTASSRDLAYVNQKKDDKFRRFEALAASTDSPIKPERVVAELQKALDKDAIVVADPGTPCPYFSAYYLLRETGRRYFSNRAHGALGYSLAASIGAHLARPKVKTVAVMGDGSFGMCVGELETAVRLKLPITFVVISNAVYGWIKAGQKSGYDKRYFSVDFGVTDHAKVAEAFGVRAFRVFDPDKLRPALKEALNSKEPTLVDIVCQPLHEAKAPVSEWVA